MSATYDQVMSDVLGLLAASGLHGAEEFRTQRVCHHR